MSFVSLFVCVFSCDFLSTQKGPRRGDRMLLVNIDWMARQEKDDIPQGSTQQTAESKRFPGTS